MIIYEFAKECKLGVRNFLSKFTTSRDGPVKGTETRLGLKCKKSILLQKNLGEERLQDYSTSLV